MAREAPDRPCLAAEFSAPLSYAEVDRAAGRFGAVLRAQGVRAGDRVAVRVDKSVDAVLVYLACVRIGAAIVPLNTAYTPSELGYFIADSQPSLLIVSPDFLSAAISVCTTTGGPRVETLGDKGDGSLAERYRAQAAMAEIADVGPSALAALLYTSGTTGRSKGAMITRDNLVSNAQALKDAWRITAEDVLVHVLPLFHVHGLFLSLNPIFAAGASARIHARFDASETIRSLSTASVFMGVPTHYTRLLASPELGRETVGHVRLFVSGSAPLLTETHREFEARTGKAILERYGMTETLVNTSNPYAGARKAGSVGLPLRGVELRITDTVRSDDGLDVGMIEIRGANVCAGYWRAPEKTAADRTADGFFRTGDLGFIDPDGYVHISGRAKDLVITGGYNVYPKEIEMALDGLDGVAESAVFGVPHPDFGEGVTAAITLRPGAMVEEHALIGLLRGHLAAYKVPKRILIVAELPRNTMGKVQKNRLRATYQNLYTG